MARVRYLRGFLLICLLAAGAVYAAEDGNKAQQGGALPAMRLLSESQYNNAIAGIFGDEFVTAFRFAPVRRTDGLAALGAATAVMTPGSVEAFDTRAREISARVMNEENRDLLVPCKPRNAMKFDQACARTFVTAVGRRLFKRPLTSEEVRTYVKAAQDATPRLGGFYEGLRAALSGMLVAPQFLYIVERAEPDSKRPGSFHLDAFSRASRLSLFLWNAPPDDVLLDAAEKGELNSEEGLLRQVDRLLASPRLEAGVRAFFDDMLVNESFADLTKDPEIYPAFSPRLQSDAREQSLRIIVDHLVMQRGDYRGLFTSRKVFLTPGLAILYKIPFDGFGETDWVPYELPADDPRAGFLSQAAFLLAHDHPGRSSPTRRGKAFREIFLCQKVPEPPANVDFSGFEDPDGVSKTARERLAAHSTNPVCAGCHKITDPIGLALENFDGASQFRKAERGAPIDVSGVLDGEKFEDAVGLGVAASKHPGLPICLATRLYQYGIGRSQVRSDKPIIEKLSRTFAEEQYRIVPLLRSIAASETFFSVAPPT